MTVLPLRRAPGGARRVRLAALIVFSVFSGSAAAQAQPPGDPVTLLLERLQAAIQAADREQFTSLLEPGMPSDDTVRFADDVFIPEVRRALVREIDREPLEGSLTGEGHQVVVEVFTETNGQARIATALVAMRRADGESGSWRIAGARGVALVQGLYRLRINAAAQFDARQLTISAEDLLLTLQEGTVFQVESEEGVTGLVLLGRGTMRFAPAPQTERGQLRIFSGEETLSAPFESAFVRLNPGDYEDRIEAGLTAVPVNERQLRRAQEVFAVEGPKSFNLDLDELSPELWYLLPASGDFLAEVRTRKHGTLTYLRTADVYEDISFFDRVGRRNIALYPSAARLAARGLSFGEDEQSHYDVLDYNIEATVTPERQFIDGRAQIRIRARVGLSSISLRLAEALAVTAVTSAEYGRLRHLRLRNQDTIIINLPQTLPRDAEITLLVLYAGRVESQDVDTEVAAVSQNPGYVPLDAPIVMPERHFLLSHRSYWYPQSLFADYATATLRVRLPPGYGCVASGDAGAGTDVSLRDLLTAPGDKAFAFRAADPLRYLALVVSRLVHLGDETVATGAGDTVRISVEANPRQQPRGRELLVTAGDVVKFYAELMHDAPYPSLTVALVEHELPGGHSPGYFAVVRTQPPYARLSYRNDPSAFQDFPDFFIAHELAHQWWGQAVGWRNYHEQWISEGFAQYFAALYAQHTRGDAVFTGMLRQFRKWAMAESDQGPVSLGYRLGHIKGEGRVFRALVYNKGAGVLHMLRRLVGDETFFNGLRRFYTEQRFRKTGTDDLRRAFEAESGRPLGRFFERWIHGVELPRVRYTQAHRDGIVTMRFEQMGELLFDIPVTVTISYADGRAEDMVVPITDRVVERNLATSGQVKHIRVNRDSAAMAEFEEQ